MSILTVICVQIHTVTLSADQVQLLSCSPRCTLWSCHETSGSDQIIGPGSEPHLTLSRLKSNPAAPSIRVRTSWSGSRESCWHCVYCDFHSLLIARRATWWSCFPVLKFRTRAPSLVHSGNYTSIYNIQYNIQYFILRSLRKGVCRERHGRTDSYMWSSTYSYKVHQI